MLNKDKTQHYIFNKNKKVNFITDKIGIILPELMARNVKLGDRLKSKLKVSTFLNSTENRNQKYLKSFVTSSDKRVKDLKTGLELLKAIKQSKKNLSPLCSQISNDFILQNSDFLIEEKKLLNENTEQETHMKINDLIQNLKNTVRNVNFYPNKPNKKTIRSLSEAELNNIKYILNNKIKNEGNMINTKIERYLDKLKNTAETDRKNFKYYADHIDIFDNLNFINYSKPKPYKIKDKECSNIVKIKKQLSSFIENNKKNKNEKKKLINNKNSSSQDIRINISSEINNLSINEYKRNENSQKDTLKILNNLAEQGRNLSLKINKKANKVNSLVDINLPHPTSYENIIKRNRDNNSSKSNINKSCNNMNNIHEILKVCNLSDPQLLSKNKLEKIINLFKKEIDILKNETYSFDKNNEDNIKDKYNLINPLSTHMNRIKKYNQKNESKSGNKKRLNVSESSIISQKLKKININNIKHGESNLFHNSKMNDSFSTTYNNRYKNYMNYKYKLMKKKSGNSYSNDSNLSYLSKYHNSRREYKDESINNNNMDSCFNL